MSDQHKPMSLLVERYSKLVQERCKQLVSDMSDGEYELVYNTDDPAKILESIGDGIDWYEYDPDDED